MLKNHREGRRQGRKGVTGVLKIYSEGHGELGCLSPLKVWLGRLREREREVAFFDKGGGGRS